MTHTNAVIKSLPPIEEYYYNRYRFYKHKAAPKVSVSTILIVLLTVISVCQYLHAKHNHGRALKMALHSSEVRQRAQTIADERGLLKDVKDEASREALLQRLVVENIDLRGAFAPPEWKNTVWIKALLLPKSTALYIWWNLDWWWRINHKKEDLTDEDKIYLIRKNLGTFLQPLSEARWETAGQEFHIEAFERELWDTEKHAQWVADKQAEFEAKHRDSSRYKRYKRWKKRA